ncbi:bifunctional diguanylate cyclase/phosphodiesterase [Natronospirillum operosum]|uniref:cyclic-guanylate-specific phosphodiesterase n=1 Tax=Natronospirillum operosum TaxID=2759953 RepID=A0A4Z0WDL9_9GAMM|nr:bifunctional diguanylate cyclase/phosphodiesterase [Natronospirillum operosum]TGG93312.1 bifunctional diguanylate cyclase/phosphodiesterase [Natronospirillum operosum]
MADRKWNLQGVWRCRLCWWLTGAVFASIVIIEAIILAPSYVNYERDLLQSLNQAGQQATRAALPAAGDMPEAALDSLVGRTLVRGIVLHHGAGEVAGEPLTTAPRDDSDLRHKRRRGDGDWLEVRWSAADLGLPWDVSARLDASTVDSELTAFVWRISGLVLLITAVVTVTTMAVLSLLVLNPLLAFRRRIIAAGQDPAHPLRHLADQPGRDEMGDTERAFNDLLRHNAGHLAELERFNNELARFPDENTNPVMRAREDGLLLYANKASAPILDCWGVAAGQPLPAPIRDRVSVALEQGQRQRFEEPCGDQHYILHIRPVSADAVHIYGLDITDRKRYEEELRHRTWHDDLTELSNRAAFEQRVGQVVNMVSAERGLAVLMMGLDGFHAVNMTAGRAAGDVMLRETARRLQNALPKEAMLARLTGDVFGVLLLNCPVDDAAWVAGIARRLVRALERPFTLSDTDYRCGLSVGITLAPADGQTADGLMRNAEMAMLRAKADRRTTGNDPVAFFVPELSERMSRRQHRLNGLRQALDSDQLVLWYQPQLAATTHEQVGVEALVRWQHPDEGMIPPADFIPLAEDTGLIVPLGRWVLTEACRQASAWLQSGHGLRVAVNLSAQQLLAPDLAGEVRALLQQFRLPAGLLELEITETAVIQDLDHTVSVLAQLAELGVCIAIDDFGTGYSSLAYLKQLPVHRVKIDQAFVRELPTNEQDALLCRAIIGLAHNLGYQVIGEGVETAEQAEWLAREGCDELQGYHFGRPVPGSGIMLPNPPEGADLNMPGQQNRGSA